MNVHISAHPLKKDLRKFSDLDRVDTSSQVFHCVNKYTRDCQKVSRYNYHVSCWQMCLHKTTNISIEYLNLSS